MLQLLPVLRIQWLLISCACVQLQGSLYNC